MAKTNTQTGGGIWPSRAIAARPLKDRQRVPDRAGATNSYRRITMRCSDIVTQSEKPKISALRGYSWLGRVLPRPSPT